MATEIYLEPELEELSNSEELTEQWKNQCIELGLEGQLSMLNKDKEQSKPSPYLFMNNTLLVMFSSLCPAVVDYRKYNKSTIPLDVLAQIALCEKNGYFKTIKIWYDDVSPDPVVVGYIPDGDYSSTQHLIARFGDEVLPFEILEQKARLRIKKQAEAEFKSVLETIDLNIDNLFSKNRQISASISPVTYSHTHI